VIQCSGANDRRDLRDGAYDITSAAALQVRAAPVQTAEFAVAVYPVGGTSRHRLPPPALVSSAPAARKVDCLRSARLVDRLAPVLLLGRSSGANRTFESQPAAFIGYRRICPDPALRYTAVTQVRAPRWVFVVDPGLRVVRRSGLGEKFEERPLRGAKSEFESVIMRRVVRPYYSDRDAGLYRP
jgi:hypothetical protein